MFHRIVLATVAGCLALAPASYSQPEGGPAPVDGHVWVPPEYRRTTRLEWRPIEYREVAVERWIPEQYREAVCREWVPPEYTTQVRHEWIPPEYTTECRPVHGCHGEVIGFQHVRVQVPGTGEWVDRAERVQVPGTGQFVERRCRELVPGTGRTVIERRREQVPGTGEWAEVPAVELVPGTGQYRPVPQPQPQPVPQPQPQPVPQPQPQPVPQPQPQPVPQPQPAEVLRATGNGARPAGDNPAQGNLMALRAARLDAFRKLAEQAYGVKVDSMTTVKDYVTLRDEIATAVRAFIAGAREVDARILPDGTAEVTLELSVDELRRQVLQFQDPNDR